MFCFLSDGNWELIGQILPPSLRPFTQVAGYGILRGPNLAARSMMAAAFNAMSISGGILLLVVVLMVLISVVAVNRGAEAMDKDTKHGGRHH